MRADLARRLAALEARQRPPAPPVDQDAARFEAMGDAELNAYLADPPPLPADVAAELADFADRLKHMTDAQLDDFFADEWAYPPPQENRREPARRR